MKRMSQLLLAGLALTVLPSATHAADKFFPCPVTMLDTQVTTPLSNGWWATPQRGELLGTDIQIIGGERTLVCRYRGFGGLIPVMHRIPSGFAKCIPRSGGFTCSTLLRTPDIGERFRDRKPPPPSKSPKSESPSRLPYRAPGRDMMKLHRSPPPNVLTLIAKVCSGRDDLRRGSVLTMSWNLAPAQAPSPSPGRMNRIATAGGRISSGEHTLFTEIPGGQCRSAPIDVTPFALDRLRSVRLTFRGGRRGFPDSVDDWDMNKVVLTAITRNSGGIKKEVALVEQSGTPLRHFDNAGTYEPPLLKQNY